jgi:hypothetical protein
MALSKRRANRPEHGPTLPGAYLIFFGGRCDQNKWSKKVRPPPFLRSSRYIFRYSPIEFWNAILASFQTTQNYLKPQADPGQSGALPERLNY